MQTPYRESVYLLSIPSLFNYIYKINYNCDIRIDSQLFDIKLKNDTLSIMLLHFHQLPADDLTSL